MAAALSARGLFDEEGCQGAENECLDAAAEPVEIQAGNGGNADGQPGIIHAQTGEDGENAKHRAAEQQRAEAAKMEAIQQEWDAAVERIRAEDPDFDIKTALADPDFAQMLKLGVKMEDAYKARYFDDIMARKTAETAKKTESGVVERIRQRGARPSENGTNPGGAAVLKTDVSKLTPAQCEELERRAMRGQIITF